MKHHMDAPVTESLTILLVEDDEIDRMAFDRFIEKNKIPFIVKKAGDVNEARQRLSAEKFDAVITDYQLPDGSAMDIIKAAQNVPAIVITGQGNERIAVEAMKAGAYDYLIKDMERNYLHVMPMTIQNAVDLHRMEEERERLIFELQKALADVKTLSGLLPICAMCKKIRDDGGYWNSLEKFIQEHSDAQFTHGYCPDCARKMLESLPAEKHV